MPVDNPTFADEGATAGVPRGWTLRSFVRGTRKVGFGPAPSEGAESFERWSRLAIDLGVVEQVFFNLRPEGFEDFSEGWAVESFVLYLEDVPTEAAGFGAGSEAFELGWLPGGARWHWTDVQAVAARFGPASIESLEQGFRNDAFHWSWSSVEAERVTFQNDDVERFAVPWIENDVGGGGEDGE